MNRFRIPVVVALCGVGFIACVSDAPRQVSTGDASSKGKSNSTTTASSGEATSPGDSTVDLSTTVSSAPPRAGSGGTSGGSPGKPWSETPASATADSTAPKLAPGHKPVDQTSFSAAVRAGVRKEATWPAGPTALAGALLPKNRIVAYYGNPHSKKMGVIGEYPEPQMLAMWDRTVAAWKAADPKTPVIPAIHLVTVVAQGAPGPDGLWVRREDSSMIERTYKWAKSRNGILFLDIQAANSTLQKELPRLLPWLARPDVHLGIDPEFYMHYEREGLRPSSKIGTMHASDVNYVIQTLDKLVADKKIPPKILIVHRFTSKMVPDAENIRPTSRRIPRASSRRSNPSPSYPAAPHSPARRRRVPKQASCRATATNSPSPPTVREISSSPAASPATPRRGCT